MNILAHAPTTRLIDIPTHSDLWYKFRETGIDDDLQGGIGASESATVIGMNDYQPTKAELYRVKVGLQPSTVLENEPMFHGTELEGYIRNLWCYHDGKGYMKNFREGKKIREVYKPNGYIVNSKYPHLFVSADGIAPAGSIRLYDLRPSGKPFNVEIKKINSNEARKWESGVPVKYIIQAQHQMLVMEMDYTEIVLFIDGQRLEVIPVHASPRIQQRILTETDRFWKSVLTGRVARVARDVSRRAGKIAEATRQQQLIDELEPLPDGNENYIEHYSKRFVAVRPEIKGDADMYELALEYVGLRAVTNGLIERTDAIKNRFALYFVKNNAEIINFGQRGTVRYTKKEDGINYVPYFFLRDAARPEAVEQVVNRINADDVL